MVYNCVHTGCVPGHQKGNFNFVDNYFKAGPSTRERFFCRTDAGHAYFADNIFEGDPEMSKDNWRGVRGGSRAKEPFPSSKITRHTAKEAYEAVLQGAGATLPKRDAIDKRLVNEVRTGKGKIINHQKEVGGYPELKTYDVPTDTDKDGMPDDWEKKYGFDPNSAADGPQDKDQDGYTNLEECLNQTDPAG